MSVMIWDSQSQAFEEAETPKIYLPGDNAWVDTEGYRHNGSEWEEVWSGQPKEMTIKVPWTLLGYDDGSIRYQGIQAGNYTVKGVKEILSITPNRVAVSAWGHTSYYVDGSRYTVYSNLTAHGNIIEWGSATYYGYGNYFVEGTQEWELIIVAK